jgi:hypothetical protein
MMDRSAARTVRVVFKRRIVTIWLTLWVFRNLHVVQRSNQLVFHSAVHGVQGKKVSRKIAMTVCFVLELQNREPGLNSELVQ